MTHKELYLTGKVGIKINSQTEFDAVKNLVQDWGAAFGFGIYFRQVDTYPWACKSKYDGSSTLVNKNYGLEVQFDSLVDFLAAEPKEPKSPETVILNSEYSAIVSEGHVKVGCQTFSHEIILKLAEVVKSFA